MSNKEIYLDNNASTKPLPEVIDKMMKIMGEDFGNPSSSHSAGIRAHQYLTEARIKVGALIGADPSNIVFTSSGTESNNMAFHACSPRNGQTCRIVTTPVEHSSIKKMCSHLILNGVEIIYLSIDSKGHFSLNELADMLKEKISLVSIQWVNNETGVIQPIADIVEMCNENGVLFHTDAAQAVGKIEINLREMPVDFLSLTGHKFHSPQGVGALYARDRFLLSPIIFGGGQEESFRPGTENLPGIVGMGKAAEIRQENLASICSKMKTLRDRFEYGVLDDVPNCRVNGDTQNRICNTTNIFFGEVDGRILLKELDKSGIRCSQTSACTNMQPEPSYVLRAMGLTQQEAYSSIRFSFGVNNTIDEVDFAVQTVADCCNKLKKISA